MSFNIRLLPSGRIFSSEPRESLLEAALRAGIALRYNCNSGTCGLCKARLVSGQVNSGRFHEFTLTEIEKRKGIFLLCTAAAESDLVIDAMEANQVKEIPEQRIETRVARLEFFKDIAILQLRTPRTNTLRFLAGQSVELTIGAERRAHAVASCPCNGMALHFHLPRRKGDSFSAAAFRLHPGDAVTVKGPYGNFLLDEQSNRPLVMVAEGSGFAPIKSLLEHALSLELQQPIRVVWIARAGGHYLPNYLRALQDALDGLLVDLLVSASPKEIAKQIATHAAAHADFYIATSSSIANALREEFPVETRISLYEGSMRDDLC